MPDVVGDIVRVTVAVDFAIESQVQMNNMYFRCSLAGGTDTRLALATNVLGLYTTNLIPLMAVTATLYGAKIAYANRVPPPAAAIQNVSTMGSGSGSTVPTQARPLLRFQTQYTGRKYRGRLYLPSPVVGQVDTDGAPKAAYITAAETLAVGLLTPFSSAGSTWHLVIAHRPVGGGTWTSDDVTDADVPKEFASQRRSGGTGRKNTIPPW